MGKNKVLDYLSNLRDNYLRKKEEYVILNSIYQAKCIGAMEALLIVLGGLSPYEYYEYKTKTINVNLIFWKFQYTIRETHEEFVLRIVDETLTKQKTGETTTTEAWI